MSQTNYFNKLKSSSIRFKVITAFTFLVLTIAILEFFAFRQVSMLNKGSLKEDFKNLKVVVNDLSGYTNQFILIDKKQPTYFKEQKSEFLTKYHVALDSFNNSISRTEIAMSDAGFDNLGELDSLQNEVLIFDSVFSLYQEKVILRGIEGFGFIGDFDKALGEITKFDFGEDNEVLLNLKLLVKDYRLTGDTEIVKNATYITYQFSRVLENYISSEEEANQVLDALANYEEALGNLAQVDSVLGTYTGQGLQHLLYQQMNTIGEKANLVQTQDKISATYDGLVRGIVINLIIIFLTTISLAIIITLVLYNGIVGPIEGLKTVIMQMGQGIIPENIKNYQAKEVGEMAKYVSRLATSMKDTSEFAKNIGNGNFESNFTPISEEDVLGNSLVAMKENLEKVAKEDEKRRWANEGFTQFIEILRNNSSSLEEMSDNVLSSLIKYLKANQGAIFIVNDTNEDDPFLEMKGCYAWERKKFRSMKIKPGEGLAGQVWMEGKEIYMKEIPDNYVAIKSGLGDANPNTVFIIPLKSNDKIYGILEIASFNDFASHELEFIQKLCESIAASVFSVKNNEMTTKLLEESKEHSVLLQAQEEEMKQNMEELQATHEEMLRKEKEYVTTINDLESKLCDIDNTEKEESIPSTSKAQTPQSVVEENKAIDAKNIDISSTGKKIEFNTSEEKDAEDKPADNNEIKEDLE